MSQSEAGQNSAYRFILAYKNFMSGTKRLQLFFAFFLVPLDFILLIFAGLSAWEIRFTRWFSGIRPVIFELPLVFYFKIIFLISLAWVFIFALAGLYRVSGFKKLAEEIARIVEAGSLGFVLIILFLFFRRELFSSRFILLAGWFFAVLYTSIGRMCARKIRSLLYRRGIGLERVMLIGSGRAYNIVRKEIEENRSLGKKVVAEFLHLSEKTRNEIASVIKDGYLDAVIQLDLSAPKELLLEIYDLCDEYHISFSFSADFFGMISPNFSYHTLSQIPVIELRETRLFGWGKILKRMVDIIGSILGIIIFGPLMIFTAIFIRLDSPGPIFYKNKRVGNDKSFFLYKFRYMKIEYCTGDEYGAEKALSFEEELIKKQSVREGPLYKILDDPRKTQVGRWIEHWSIDELPQFFNVLKGELSLVGPRPHQPREVEKYLRHHKKVFAVKPGITGLAQVSGRSELAFEDEVRLDTLYIENWSLLLDLIIIFKTPRAMIQKHKNV